MVATGLVGLPVEIRMMIYRELLTSKVRAIRAQYGSFDRPLRNETLYPAILQTCKLLHAEAGMVLYGENVFQYSYQRLRKSFYNPGCILGRGDMLSSRAFEKIQHVIIMIPSFHQIVF